MNRLKELRKSKKLTQEDVAKYLEVPTATYNRYETEKYEADYKTLLKLSKLFSVSINFILGEEEENLIMITKNELEDLKYQPFLSL